MKNNTGEIRNTIRRKRVAKKPNYWKYLSLSLFTLFMLLIVFDIRIEPRFGKFNDIVATKQSVSTVQKTSNIDTSELAGVVIPAEGIEIPIKWGDLGQQLIADGVVDETKFREIFAGGIDDDEEKMLTGNWDGNVTINQQNSSFLLDLFWAFGLANKNDILDNGEMTNEAYGGDASQFASTGGWTLAKGSVMDHYSKHPYVVLTSDQQALVDKVSSGIYRPCCGNSTHFPDCNHGMAMLGILELMAANGVGEEDMYKVALGVNSYWFPQTYIDLATYFEEQGTSWDKVDPKLALSSDYSSGRGYLATRQKIKSLPTPQQSASGCGV